MNVSFEKEVLVTFMTRARCTICGEELICTQISTFHKNGYITQALHECKNGHVVTLDKQYPYISYEQKKRK
jgi:hypothetical protein